MNIRFAILLFIIAAAVFTSCKNNDNVFPVSKPDGRFKVINASSDTINYFLNGTRLNNGSSLSPGVATSYIQTELGPQNFQFKKDGSSDVLFSWPEQMMDSVYYTLYITGPTADKAFRIKDVFSVDSGFVSLGFVNAAPDIGNLNVVIDGKQKFSASAFKIPARFLSLDDGDRDIKVYDAAGTLLKDTTVTVNQDHVYTLYSYGLKNGTGSSKFNIGLTLNL